MANFTMTRLAKYNNDLYQKKRKLEAENKRLREALEIILKTTEQDPEFVCFIKATIFFTRDQKQAKEELFCSRKCLREIIKKEAKERGNE